MPIRASELRRQLLRVSPDTLVGAALKELRARPRPTDWLLLVDLGGAYAVVGVEDIARRAASVNDPLNQPIRAFAGAACPTADVEEELEDARARLANQLDLLVLRAGQPFGVLSTRPIAAATSGARLLLSQAAGWKPRIQGSAVLGVEEEGLPKAPAAQPAGRIEPIQQRADRYVNTDFASEAQPAQALDRRQALQPGQAYFFRLNVGELEAETTIEFAPAQLPELITRQDVDLTIVLFSESFAIERASGVLSVPATDLATVKTPASLPSGMDANAPLARERLLFRVTAPAAEGIAELRVNMYYNGMLVQSRLVTAVVGAGQPLDAAGLMRRSVLDFNLSPTLAPRHLSDIAPHKLSLMVNSNADGSTHAFRVLAQEGNELFANSATLEPNELNDLILQTRAALQKVAWGKPDAWVEGLAYRYDTNVAGATLAQNFANDMINMAVRGALTYNALKNSLGQGRMGAAKLRDLMRTPGVVQLACKISANDVVPIAMFYDWKLDTRAATLTICEQFEASLASKRPLAGEPCFLGNCPHRDDENPTVICPSGFWGFRHDIGMPWPAPYGPEVATQIGYTGAPLMDIALNREFPALPDHLQRLGGLGYQTQSQEARDKIFQMFKQTQPQLVYFYCHGVLNGTTPTLKVGPPQDYIDTSNFDNLEIGWPDSRPLVFMNGCHTTSLSPGQALSFVRAFVEDVSAAGVIGTEITVFEPLAQTFAETFLPLFAAGIPFGRAIREARLKLLAQRNPLGLVYQPYAYAGLKMVKTA